MPDWISELLISRGRDFAISLGFVAAFLALAYLRIAERGQTHRDVLLNVRIGVATQIGLLFVGPLGALASRAFQHFTGSGWIDLGLANPEGFWQIALAAFVYLALFDFSNYWWHRLQHGHWFFWAAHRLHHSDTALNASTALRTHWLDSLFSPFFVSMPVVILFQPIGHSDLLVYLLVTSIGFWNHANLRVSLGPFLTSPLYHRIHHSNDPADDRKNLAGVFPAYDWLFGTYQAPVKDKVHATGLFHGEREDTLRDATLGPFKVWREGYADLRRRLSVR
jgi:sterol desaturase/sphingolipid hydroxylase (fatty acid hydroxylase superfamily)